MISQYDVIKSVRKQVKDDENYPFNVSTDDQFIFNCKTGKIVGTVEEFVNFVRREQHCDFETLYYEHATLTHVFRCRECGTVIFGGDDERYDPACRCPTCCNDPSACINKFWTKEEIDADPEKQKVIDTAIALQKKNEEAEARRKARDGLYDHQRFKKYLSFGSRVVDIQVINYNWNHELNHTDRFLEISCFNKEDGIVRHRFRIPLSFYNIYLRWIFPRTKQARRLRNDLS